MGFFRKLFGRKRRGDSAVSVDKTVGINLTGSVLRVPKSAFNVTVTPWGLKAETALGATWQHQYGLQTTVTKNLKLKEWVVDYILANSDRGMRQGSLNGGLSFNVLRDFDQGSICVFNTWSFHDGKTVFFERGGTLYKNWDAERGIGEAVGTLSEEGEVSITDRSIGFINLKINSGIVRKPDCAKPCC
ncbi:hypothetical protein [Neisseria subflava]|uniref:hypothetical protein n=1 Tax=Neisseria subflava TaxID=28449 RepID=UPI00280B9E14|nr:hypothetical protein [Neisseria subflava]